MGNESVGNLEVLMDALDYIEAHLREDIRTERVAEYCYCSKSGLEKLFRNVNHLSVHDYVVRRRMSLALSAASSSRLAWGKSTRRLLSSTHCCSV